ncbi:hypothetical protein DBR24_05085 [Pseudomonas sp. HMWF006]|nr:hypothetical protein DBR24_05085 [Pseudomonas sp. HMWF006]PTT63115.1 hypothetical protein DBR26_23240 [Pseudomonas sp. HMWF007]PTT95269.1 hypothetical protein DBR29_00765 [Pseudomonas sp. HMWF005]RON60529.1 hypothetical protein BK669_24190 [Pseudomonas fluorescens]
MKNCLFIAGPGGLLEQHLRTRQRQTAPDRLPLQAFPAGETATSEWTPIIRSVDLAITERAP